MDDVRGCWVFLLRMIVKKQPATADKQFSYISSAQRGCIMQYANALCLRLCSVDCVANKSLDVAATYTHVRGNLMTVPVVF